jgi:hypothetical protein
MAVGCKQVQGVAALQARAALWDICKNGGASLQLQFQSASVASACV